MARAVDGAKRQKNIDAAERVRKATIGAGEPSVSQLNYKSDLISALNYYRVYEDDKNKRKWVQKYLGKDKDKLSLLSEASDHAIHHVAVLIRLKEREQYLEAHELSRIDTMLDNIFETVKQRRSVNVIEDEESQTTQTSQVKPVLSIAQKVERNASLHIAEIEHEIDLFILNKKSDFDMAAYLVSKQVSAPIAKHIGLWFRKTHDEVNEAIEGWDAQLNEGYSYFKPAELKRFGAFIKSIIDACVQQKVKVAKPRIPKVKPPTEIVKRVQYLPEFAELGLKSVHPSKLVNSNEAWLYNTKTRRLTLMKAEGTDVLIVKGTSLVNFDMIKSETKTLRKPEEFFKDSKLTKINLNSAWKAIKTKPVKANGRINADTIIVSVF